MTEGKEGSYQPSDEEVKKTELSLTSIEQEWSVYRDQRRLTSRSNFSEVHPNVKGWSVSKEDREKIWESLESERISDESFELAWENRFHLSSSEDTESNERVETILKEWNKIRSEELVRTLNDPGLAEQLRVLEPYQRFCRMVKLFCRWDFRGYVNVKIVDPDTIEEFYENYQSTRYVRHFTNTHASFENNGKF